MHLNLICLLIVVSSFGQQPKLETLSWNEQRLLTWDDFKDMPQPNTNAAALTASGISFGFSVNKTGQKITGFNTNVECVFYPEKSWYKPKLANNYILNHEQMHFNITELHARKFRKQISNTAPNQALKSQLNRLYETITKASVRMQRRYDSETNHSINKEKQQEWDIFITEELKKLDAFKTQ